MTARVEILRQTREGPKVDLEHYGAGGAQFYKGEEGIVTVRGEARSAEVWRKRIPTKLNPGDEPIVIRLEDGAIVTVTAVDNYQPSE